MDRVSTHLHQALQRVGLHRRDQPRGPVAQRRGLGAAGVPQLLGDLQEVTDDHLVVGRRTRVLVDGPRHRRGLHRLGLERRLAVGGERRTCQPNPQLGPEQSARRPGFDRRGVAEKGESIEGERVQLEMGRGRQCGPTAAGRAAKLGIGAERPQHLADLAGLDATHDGHGGQLMAMKRGGEPLQHRVARIRGDPVDDQLLLRHAKGDLVAAGHDTVRPPGDRLGGGSERRMPFRVNSVLVQRDCELDEEHAVLARQAYPLGTGRRVLHRP